MDRTSLANPLAAVDIELTRLELLYHTNITPWIVSLRPLPLLSIFKARQ